MAMQMPIGALMLTPGEAELVMCSTLLEHLFHGSLNSRPVQHLALLRLSTWLCVLLSKKLYI